MFNSYDLDYAREYFESGFEVEPELSEETEEDFAAWLVAVNQILDRVGISLADLPDWESREFFESGATIEEAAIEAVADALPAQIDPYKFLGLE